MYRLTAEDLTREATEILPKPKGWRMLVALPQMKESTDGGVILTAETIAREQTASIVGCVVAMGDVCYQDTNKFPSGPWCQEGDWIMFRSYTGTRFKVNGQEYRLVNDDSVEAVVDDPREIKRAW
jgi:co-chaperonin GroES (HSP10)